MHSTHLTATPHICGDDVNVMPHCLLYITHCRSDHGLPPLQDKCIQRNMVMWSAVARVFINASLETASKGCSEPHAQ